MNRLAHFFSRTAQKPTIFFALVFAVVTVIFFAPTLFFGTVPLPTDLVRDYQFDEPRVGENIWLRDTVVQIVPYEGFVFHEWKAGRVPDMHSYLFGQELSIQSTGQASVWSLLNIFIPLFQSDLSFFAFIIVVTFWLSGFSTAAFLHAIGLRTFPALFGGVLFQWSGALLAWTTWGIIVPALAWMPLCLLAVYKITQRYRHRFLALGALSWWGVVSAGHLQFVAMTVVVIVLYAIARLIQQRRIIQQWSVSQYMMIGVVLFLLAAGTIALIQPFIDASPLSHRAHAVYTMPLFIGTFIQFVFPRIFGDPNTFASGLNPIQSAASVGVAALVVIAYRFLWVSRRMSLHELFWFGLSAISVVLMVFPKIVLPVSVVFPQVYNYPFSRLIIFVSFALAFFGATSLDVIMRHMSHNPRRIVRNSLYTLLPFVACAMMLVVLFSNRLFDDFLTVQLPVYCGVIIVTAFVLYALQLYSNRHLRIAACGLLFVLVIAEQWIAFHSMIPQQSRDPLTAIPAHIQFLQEQKSGGSVRIYSEVSPLDLYMYYGIESLFGYDPNFPDSVYVEYKREGKIVSHINILNAQFSQEDLPYLKEKQVDFIVSKQPWDLPLVHESEGVMIYQLP